MILISICCNRWKQDISAKTSPPPHVKVSSHDHHHMIIIIDIIDITIIAT